MLKNADPPAGDDVPATRRRAGRLLERWWGEGELVAQPLKAVVGGAGSLIRWRDQVA